MLKIVSRNPWKKKTAAELENKDRFYLAGKKYCVIKDLVFTTICYGDDDVPLVTLEFVEVDGSTDNIGILLLPPNTEFAILTGESGIGEKTYNAMQKVKP